MSHDLVGKRLPPLDVTIMEDDVRRYCRAVAKPWDGIVPWFYLAHVGGNQVSPPDRVDRLSGRPALYPLPGSFKRTLVGGMEWEFLVRPRIGDRITIEACYTSVKEKTGERSGIMIISTLELTFTNHQNEKVAVQRLARIHR
jgi:hypothetical protein